MERRDFIKRCCYAAVGLPLAGAIIASCDTIYYANASTTGNKISVPKNEFVKVKNDKTTERDYVLVKTDKTGFPICLDKTGKDSYLAILMMCTHKSCELNVGGGIYSCPCHGSEFSKTGRVLEGPAIDNLKTYKTETDDEHIYIILS